MTDESEKERRALHFLFLLLLFLLLVLALLSTTQRRQEVTLQDGNDIVLYAVRQQIQADNAEEPARSLPRSGLRGNSSVRKTAPA